MACALPDHPVVLKSPLVSLVLDQDHVDACLQRHLQGDWGSVALGDWAVNEQALETGAGFLLSVFAAYPEQPIMLSGTAMVGPNRLMVLTNLDTGVTTVLRPSELRGWRR